MALLFSVVAAIGVFLIESRTAGSTFDDWLDTLWWGLSTVTTVGYGDVAPQSAAGRLLAIVAMLAGIAAFGWFTALLTSHFVDARQDEEDTAVRKGFAEISTRLARLEHLLQRPGQPASDLSSVEESLRADRHESHLSPPSLAMLSRSDEESQSNHRSSDV